jgi:hypothetical protein
MDGWMERWMDLGRCEERDGGKDGGRGWGEIDRGT